MGKVTFEINNAEILESKANDQFAIARIQAFSSGENRHDMTCSVDVLKRTAPTIYEKPIVFDYDKRFGDFGSHVEKPFIAGFVVPDSAEFEELPDGRTSMSVMAKIWKYYSGNFISIFKREKTDTKKVSVEMDLTELEAGETPNSPAVMKDFAYTAICVLGTMVTEASPGAHLEMVSFSSEPDKEKFFNKFSRYEEIDFSIPAGVKNNAREGLDIHGSRGHNASPVSLAMARFLVRETYITPEKLRNIAKHFSSPKYNLEDTTKAKRKELMEYKLWGGKPAVSWSANMAGQLDEADKKVSVYFKEDIMPYSSMKDVNPAIKGIKPTPTLAQANQIAKEADGIGQSDEKNGWAIAIANFKKRHVVRDGKWVSKNSKEVTNMALPRKDEMGKGEAISVDKSADSVSKTPWGNVDKPALMNKVLSASNYKSLVKDVYALVEAGWEDHPSSSLKYPIMQISGGKAVYNRYGLAQALLRAEQQNESGVVSKVKGIYSKLGLDEKKEKQSFAVDPEDAPKDEEDMAADNGNSEEKPKDDEEMSADKPEEKPEDEQDMASDGDKPEEEPKDEEDMSADEPEGDKPEEEEDMQAPADEPEEQDNPEEEKEEGDMSTYGRVEQVLKMLEEEDKHQDMMEAYQAGSLTMAELMDAMMGKMGRMMEAEQTYMEKMSALQQFKDDVEAQSLKFEVDKTLKSVERYLTEEELSTFREEVKEFSLEDIDGWKNRVRAFAFEKSKGIKEEDSQGRYPLPVWGSKSGKKSNSPWH